jgi:4-hydroxy-3-methylbut-2-enyl diphosphate reductase
MGAQPKRGITVVIAKRAGFCFGVKRAVDMAFEAAAGGSRVFTLGPIIHNPQVIEQLRLQGVEPTDTIDDDRIGTLIIRTHGIPKEASEALLQKNYTVIDATCPFVKKAQQYAKLLRDGGYQVVILGDREHPEVKGLMSYADHDALVLNGGTPMPRLKSKVGVVVQTTQPVNLLRHFVSEAIHHVKELKVFNTICNSTALRLEETERMAKKVDVMFVVGGKNSANTTQLACLCTSLGIPTHHIETASEIQVEWLDGVQTVGITAGASTPDWIIQDVEHRMRQRVRGGRG